MTATEKIVPFLEATFRKIGKWAGLFRENFAQ
jgi:hypothetical protein